MRFHNRLRELRKQSPLMQKEIAALIGVSVRTFQQYELGIIEPNIEKLILLSRIFNVSIDDLVCRDAVLADLDAVQPGTSPSINA